LVYQGITDMALPTCPRLLRSYGGGPEWSNNAIYQSDPDFPEQIEPGPFSAFSAAPRL
jgi:hypothetical protein